MNRTDTIHCLECDAEIQCEVIRDECGSYLDTPESCPECNANLDDQCSVGVSDREDFHSDI